MQQTAPVQQALLEPREVGQLSGEFFIPAYQRGYRWGPDEVRRLLEDIHDNQEQPYYLQPLVVRGAGQDRWEVVDGQQRLTTLYLIFKYIRDNVVPATPNRYSLTYETREGSTEFLDTLDPARQDENIDFHHIFDAYRCIEEWFQESPGQPDVRKAMNVLRSLNEFVHIIWYEVPPEVDQTTLFTRLNVGRIPLTDAELVKALVLSRARSSKGDPSRRYEVAAQWDSIERDLRNAELWAFITRRPHDDPTHIGLLLDTLARGPEGPGRKRFHTFEALRPEIEADADAFWARVLDLHSRVVGWFEDRDLFHKIGFLVANDMSLGALIALAEGRTRSSFVNSLDAKIRDVLKLTEGDLRDLDYDSSKTLPALLLMNVETVRQRNSTERFSFSSHANGSWSLEHIHAQNAETLTRAEQWIDWLTHHRAALSDTPGIDAATRDRLLTEIDEALPTINRTKFQLLEPQVTRALTADPTLDMHALSNLALLDSGLNSALSNSVFEVKRRIILKHDRDGHYIPACTRNVFLKYYTTAESQQLHFWGDADRQAYLQAMVDVLRGYLTEEEA